MFKDLSFHTKPLADLKWNTDGQYLGSISYDKTARIGQLELSGSIKLIQTVTCTTSMSQVCWNPEEISRFCICGDDKTVELWDVRASRASSKIVTMGSNLFSCWSPNGQYLAFLNKGNNVIVFDAQASRQIKKVRFAYEVNELQWTANSDHLLIATAGSDVGNIDVLAFKNEDMTLIDTWTAHTSNCHSLKIDRDYRRMAVAGGDYNVSLWDLEDLVCHHNVAFDYSIRAMGYSGDGQHIALGSDASPILMLCNSDTAEIMQKIDCRHSILALAWHPSQPVIGLALDDRSSSSSSHGYSPQFMRLLTLPSL